MALLFKDHVTGKTYKSIGNAPLTGAAYSVSHPTGAGSQYRHPGSPPGGLFCGGSVDGFSPATTSATLTLYARTNTLSGTTNAFLNATYTGLRVGDVYVAGRFASQSSGTNYHLVRE